MPKPRDDIQDLKRRLGLLHRLEARAVVCADGLFLFEPGIVRDPRPLIAACQQGTPSSATIAASVQSAAPVRIDASLIAAAHRDLRTLEVAPALVALAREAPRIFHRYGAIDQAWIDAKRSRLAQLAGMSRSARDVAETSWFERALSLIRLVHGDGAGAVVERALAQLSQQERALRTRARRGLFELLVALEGGPRPASERSAKALDELLSFAKFPGRSRVRRIAALLREQLACSVAIADHGAIGTLPLVAQVRAIGERIIAAMTPADRSERDHRTRVFLAHFALAFDPRPRDGGPLVIDAVRAQRATARLAQAIERFGGRKLTTNEVLSLLELDSSHSSDAIVGLVERGLPIAKVERLAELGKATDLAALYDSPESAEAYADWAITLVPHYASLGLKVPISPEMFAKLHGTRRDELAVLAVCLMKHHVRASGGAEEAIARLDATLGLFGRRPADASGVIATLSSTASGAGRERFPAFAAWLEDDALLDRYLYLARLAGAPLALSNNLRSDFELAERIERERAHLAGRADLSPGQRTRLLRIESGELGTPVPAWTRRRLAERVRELHAQAYEAEIERVFRRIVREVWGITVDQWNDAWRDAIRFYLAVDDNRELLGTVLRAAAAGADLARTSPQNKRWLEQARGRFDVDAWLAPRDKKVAIHGKRYRLAVERDPIQVLRMGIPFGTCLSLEDGCNAAATVINAADANKHVLYLRDERDDIVARKLIAICEPRQLVGYQAYVADASMRVEVEALIHSMCREIAADARLTLASWGKPSQLHEGFWYDDGTEPFDSPAPSTDVESYCRSLGRPPPAIVSEGLECEARAFSAVDSGDIELVRDALAQAWRSVTAQDRAARWLVDRLDPEDFADSARQMPLLVPVAMRSASARGPSTMLRLAARIGDWRAGDCAADELRCLPKTAEIAAAILDACQANKRASPESFDTHGFVHQALRLLPEYLAAIPVSAALASCDRADGLWASIVQQSSECVDCRNSAEHHALQALVIGFARAPDPDAVLRWLDAKRTSVFARRAALRIAARYSLADDAPPPVLPPPHPQPLRACRQAVRALRKLARATPEFRDDPDLFAALIRQCAAIPSRELPTPSCAPFEALGDMLSTLELESVLQPWFARRGRSMDWDPGPWELYFHRRHRTSRRDALLDEAMAHAPRASRASDWLALLGDSDAIAAIARVPRREREARRGKRGSPDDPSKPCIASLVNARTLAVHVREQIVAIENGQLPNEGSVRAAIGEAPRDAHAIDAGVLARVFSELGRHLHGAAATDVALEAWTLARLATLPELVSRDLIVRLLRRLLLEHEQERGFVRGYLSVRDAWWPGEAAELVLTIAAHDDLRQSLFDALARTDDDRFEHAVRALTAAAGRNGDTALLGPVFAGGVRALCATQQHQAIASIQDKEWYRRAIRVLVGEACAISLLEIYKATDSHEHASIFLDEVATSPVRDELRARVDALADWGAKTENAARHAWLRAVIG